jgi:hypothetical protein
MTMIKSLQWVTTAGLFCFCLSTTAQAVDYSADAVFHETPGATRLNKVFVSNGNVRIEAAGQTTYEILDTAKQTGHFIVPGKKMSILPDPIAPQRGARYSVGPIPCVRLSSLKAPAACKKLGLDTVNGQVAEKWQYSLPQPGGTFVRTIWVDRRINAVVKVQRDKGVMFELLNIHLGPQPPSLFLVPTSSQTKQSLGQK